MRLPQSMTGASSSTPTTLENLSDHDRQRLQELAWRYHVRADTTLRPVADVMYDLRSRHGVQLSMNEVLELLGGRGGGYR
jgi:hypothetical protein